MSQTATVVPTTTKPKPRRRWLKVLVSLFVLWLVFLGFIDWAMHQPPDKFGRVMKHMPFPAFFLFPFETMWNDARKGTLAKGSEAPDFNLETYDKSGMVQLSSFRGKEPVVLVFGSYT